MNHTEAWKLVAGDILIGLMYVFPPIAFFFAGALLASHKENFYYFFAFGSIIYIVANLISAGVIK